MGSKTVARLLILMVVVGSMGVGGYFLWRSQVGRQGHDVLARADRAVEQGDFVKAVELYTQYLAVVPNDVEVRLKLADASLKIDKLQKRRQDVLAIYESILNQYPGRTDVRRRAAETAIELGMFAKARGHLKSLLETARDDGHLEYLMARCSEQDGESARAADYYRDAIKHGAPERLEASQELAILLRDKLGQREEADRVIDAMVSSASDDYRVYLGRGLYRERNRAKGATKGGEDLRKAQQLAPHEPKVYLELARAVERESGLDGYELRLMSSVKDVGEIPTKGKALIIVAAVDNRLHFRIFDRDGSMVVDTDEVTLSDRAKQVDDLRQQLADLWPPRALSANDKDRLVSVVTSTVGHTQLDAVREILDKGLATAPKAIELYLALSNLEKRAGRLDRAADALYLGLKALPDEISLRVELALLLANRGDTGRLDLQIDALERMGIGAYRPFIQYLKAHALFNKHEFYKARQLLAPLQPEVAGAPGLKSLVNLLLARCYAELSEPELQREATLRAYSVNPKNITARLNWIQSLIARGDLDGLDEAIREYRGLSAEQPGAVRVQLASLLLDAIAGCRRRSASGTRPSG